MSDEDRRRFSILKVSDESSFLCRNELPSLFSFFTSPLDSRRRYTFFSPPPAVLALHDLALLKSCSFSFLDRALEGVVKIQTVRK